MTPLCHPAARVPLVGRELELRQLTELLRAAEGGEAQLAAIVGPAGIGKTRLAEELVEQADRRGARVAIGRCWEAALPLWPWRRILRELGAPEILLEPRHGRDLWRFARFVAVLEYLRSGRGAAPFVIVLDDAHLADRASLLLVRFLARERDLPLLLLLTCRERTPQASGDVDDAFEGSRENSLTIRLAGLSEEAVRAYLAALDAPLVDAALLPTLTAVTQGNPLHLRSVTIGSGLAPGGGEDGLERALRAAIERLPGDDRRWISLSALLGSEVSAHELARLGDTEPALVAASLARAAELGLCFETASGRFQLVHERVRDAAASLVPLAERLSFHARAAALRTGDDPEQLARCARHALAAASRSMDDARRALTIAREAARALRTVDGFESAAALLERATEMRAAAALDGPAAELAVEHAEAVLSCGRLLESRTLFQRAARIAEREGDSRSFARAALGLGGLWVSEHRLADEAERMLALQRKALEALPSDATILRVRLRTRLAAEEAYRGEVVEPVLEAIEAARRTNDACALAEALSLAHNVLMRPEHTARRLPLASELISTAARIEDGLLSLLGLCWRTADLFLLGDRGAPAALEDLRLRADALRCRSIVYIARTLDVMQLIRSGDFERAESAAAECFALGREVGDADALAYHGAHVAAIRYFQGREAEVAELAASIAASPTLLQERERAFVSAAALFAFRAGQLQAAQTWMRRLARDGIGSIPSSASWLTTVLGVVELAHALNEPVIAQAAYDALLPYAELPVMASLAVVCFGSVQRCLGQAALTCGKLDLAIEHLAAAVAANEDLGHRPAAIQSRAELGLAHLRRAAGDDARTGSALLHDACAAGEATGMRSLAARWRESARSLTASRAATRPVCASMTRLNAASWRVALESEVAIVPDRAGMHYLAELLASPDRGIPALTLVVRGAAPPRGDSDALMDRKTITAVRERIEELRETPSLSPREHRELDRLTDELMRATGLGGRTRSFADAPERARTAVRKAIKRALGEIAAANPSVGEHLAQRVQTGSVCTYRLEPLLAGPPIPPPSRATELGDR